MIKGSTILARILSAAIATRPVKIKKVAPARGFVFYDGPSRIDGSPIVAIATFGSKNAKTGSGLVQTWIIAKEVSPLDAVKNGSDRAVCGSCQLRPIIMNASKAIGHAPSKARQCYVKVFQAPRSVWSAYHRGRYPSINALPTIIRERISTLRVRIGSYGNPSALPFNAWESLLAIVPASGTGYDHLWESADPRFASIVMASVNSPEQARDAQALGYRTFRVRKASDPILPNEIVCPASKEAGKRLTCDRCLACNGNPSGKDTSKVRSVVIIEH